MLSSLTSLNAASTDSSSGARWGRTIRSFLQQQSVANGLIAVSNQLGTAIATPMTADTSSKIDGTDASGTGATMSVNKVSSISSSGLSGVTGLTWGRRLSSCTDIHIQQTNWIGSNPFSYADPTQGEVQALWKGPLNAYVPANATVKILSMEACGEPLEYVQSDARRMVITLTGSSALSVTLTMPAVPGDPDEGYGWDPVCAWFNANTSEWSTEGTEIVSSADESGGDVTCDATGSADSPAGGYNAAYTGVWVEYLLPTTTTSTTSSTRTTSTTTTTTTRTSSWPCQPALLPSPYWRAPWNCSWGLDGNDTDLDLTENYTCVALCAEDSTDTTIVQCDGQKWVFVQRCPTSVDSDEESAFGDNAVLYVAAGGGFLGVLLCAACVGCCYLYYRYRQEQNDKEEPLVEHHVPWEEDEPAYEARNRPNLRIAAQSNEQDHHFWEWAREWVNHHPVEGTGPAALPALEPLPMPVLEGLPPPPRLVERAPDTPEAPEAVPGQPMSEETPRSHMADIQAQPQLPIVEEVAVEEDPQFWEWAHEWAQLRVTTQPEAPPPAPANAPPDGVPHFDPRSLPGSARAREFTR